jgi:hypothetical protein
MVTRGKAWHGWIDLSGKGQGTLEAQDSENGANDYYSDVGMRAQIRIQVQSHSLPKLKFPYRTQAVFFNSSIGSIYNLHTEYR